MNGEPRDGLVTWLPSALSLAASVVFACVLVVETVSFRRNAENLGDDAQVMTTALDLCECAAGCVGAFAVAGIVSMARRLRRRLRRAQAENVEMRRLEAFRREFISNVTHELRTPLTALQAAVEVLGENGDALSQEERRSLCAAARDASVRLDRLAEDILSLARIEKRQEEPTLDFEPCDIALVVGTVCEMMRPKAAKDGITLSLASVASVMRPCDVGLVEQAMGNLVENALRHSGSQNVELSLAATAGGRAAVSVVDHGVGVAPEHRARLFERFYRPARSHGCESGTGLGLAIVKHVARLHGGEATLCETPGGGATFTLVI